MKFEQPAFDILPALTAYGDGGFRFADGRIRGPVLISPQGVSEWNVSLLAALTAADFSPLTTQEPGLEFVLLGVGKTMTRPPLIVREAFRSASIGLEFMDTGAACRLYNVLASEGRRIGAALLPVD